MQCCWCRWPHVVHKCFGMLIGLSHVRHYLPQNVIPTIVHGLVLSHVRYCITVFGNCSTKTTDSFKGLLTFVLGWSLEGDHITDVLNGPDWFTSKQLSDYHLLSSLIEFLDRKNQHHSLHVLVDVLVYVTDERDKTIACIYPVSVQKQVGVSLLTLFLPSALQRCAGPSNYTQHCTVM